MRIRRSAWKRQGRRLNDRGCRGPKRQTTYNLDSFIHNNLTKEAGSRGATDLSAIKRSGRQVTIFPQPASALALLVLPGGRPRLRSPACFIQLGGRPRLFPRPRANLSREMIASSICSLSCRSSNKILFTSMICPLVRLKVRSSCVESTAQLFLGSRPDHCPDGPGLAAAVPKTERRAAKRPAISRLYIKENGVKSTICSDFRTKISFSRLIGPPWAPRQVPKIKIGKVGEILKFRSHKKIDGFGPLEQLE